MSWVYHVCINSRLAALLSDDFKPIYGRKFKTICSGRSMTMKRWILLQVYMLYNNLYPFNPYLSDWQSQRGFIFKRCNKTF